MSKTNHKTAVVEDRDEKSLTLWGRVVWLCSRIGIWLVIGLMALVSSPFLIWSWFRDNEPDRYHGGQR
jgi:hypothetical protein